MSEKFNQKGLAELVENWRVLDCVRAIDSIGGDPATVGELVKALKACNRMLVRRSNSDGCVYNEEGRARDMADAVLDKLLKEQDMSQPNEAAFPLDQKCDDGTHFHTSVGLTKQEYFAAAALQGLCAGVVGHKTLSGDLAEWAVDIANALIAELNKETPNE